MKKTLFLFTFIFLTSLTFAQKPIENQAKILWMQGIWSGTGYQIDGQSWSVQLDYSDNKIMVSYPSLGCSGYWEIVNIGVGNIEFLEKITINNGCDQNGKVIVSRVDDNNISVAWFMPSINATKPIAFTVLHH